MAMKKPKGPPRDLKDRSNKDCCCGGHNANNHKKNLNHHSTLTRREIRILRRFKEWIKNQTDLPPEFSAVIDKHFWDLI